MLSFEAFSEKTGILLFPFQKESGSKLKLRCVGSPKLRGLSFRSRNLSSDQLSGGKQRIEAFSRVLAVMVSDVAGILLKQKLSMRQM